MFEKFREIKRKKTLEREVSFAVRYFAQLLRMGVSFRTAYDKLIESDFEVLSSLLEEAKLMKKKKIHLKDALLEVEKKINSGKARDFFSLLIQAESSGPSKSLIETAEIMADRFFEESVQDYKKFTSRSQLVFMIHIAVTALLPTVLALMFGTSGVVSGKEFSGFAINFVFLVLIPLVSASEMALMEVIQPC